MVDDLHGTEEWNVFTSSMHKVVPDRAIVDLSSRAGAAATTTRAA